jgi:hypothetical protein
MLHIGQNRLDQRVGLRVVVPERDQALEALGDIRHGFTGDGSLDPVENAFDLGPVSRSH